MFDWPDQPLRKQLRRAYRKDEQCQREEKRRDNRFVLIAVHIGNGIPHNGVRLLCQKRRRPVQILPGDCEKLRPAHGLKRRVGDIGLFPVQGKERKSCLSSQRLIHQLHELCVAALAQALELVVRHAQLAVRP